MSGPPTPPPSSALEHEDAARVAVPPVIAEPAIPVPSADAPQQPIEQQDTQLADAAPASVPTYNPYRQAFTVIADLAAREKYEDLVLIAETGDLNVGLLRVVYVRIIGLITCHRP
jgi:COP9 signalosome complex subunit 8